MFLTLLSGNIFVRACVSSRTSLRHTAHVTCTRVLEPTLAHLLTCASTEAQTRQTSKVRDRGSRGSDKKSEGGVGTEMFNRLLPC